MAGVNACERIILRSVIKDQEKELKNLTTPHSVQNGKIADIEKPLENNKDIGTIINAGQKTDTNNNCSSRIGAGKNDITL